MDIFMRKTLGGRWTTRCHPNDEPSSSFGACVRSSGVGAHTQSVYDVLDVHFLHFVHDEGVGACMMSLAHVLYTSYAMMGLGECDCDEDTTLGCDITR